MDAREKAYQWVDAHRDDMVSLWKDMVTIDSGIGVYPMKNAGTPSLPNGAI